MNNSVEELMSQNRELIRQNNELTLILKEKSEEIKQLRQIIANLSRRMYVTKSEKTHPGQLSLFEDESFPFNEAETTAEQTVETKTMTVKKRKSKGRKEELVKDLPEVIHIHELNKDEKQCDCCGHHLHEMTENYVRCEVEFIPTRLIKHVHKQKVYECRHCKQHSDKAFIKKADLPKTVMNNSLASPSVLAHLCCQKIEYSLPFYRQTKEWLWAGLKLSVVTLSNWFIKSAKWLKLIYNKMHEYLMKQEVLHADETVYQILKRSDGKPPTSQSRIWLFRNSQHAPYKIIMYHSTLTRARSVAQEFLKDFSGYLHCDGYTVYNHLPNIELSTCWAHVRRKFREAGHGKEVKHCLAYCNELFILERQWKALSNEERLEQRKQTSQPIVKAFFEFIEAPTFMKGKLKSAVNYALKLKHSLMKFLDDGRLDISNNLAEQAIRPVAIGRKNWNFSLSEHGAESNTIIYSIIQTAAANGLDAYSYIKYLLEKLPQLSEDMLSNSLDDLMPWSENMQHHIKHN